MAGSADGTLILDLVDTLFHLILFLCHLGIDAFVEWDIDA